MGLRVGRIGPEISMKPSRSWFSPIRPPIPPMAKIRSPETATAPSRIRRCCCSRPRSMTVAVAANKTRTVWIPAQVAAGSTDTQDRELPTPAVATFHAPADTGATCTRSDSGSGPSCARSNAVMTSGAAVSQNGRAAPRAHRLVAAVAVSSAPNRAQVPDAPNASGVQTAAAARISTATPS
jgi:hypothetical protein